MCSKMKNIRNISFYCEIFSAMLLQNVVLVLPEGRAGVGGALGCVWTVESQHKRNRYKKVQFAPPSTMPWAATASTR